MTTLPKFLDEPVAVDGRTYGRLFTDGKLWRIKGEPYVIQLAKRLFPGSNSGTGGEAVFPLTRRRIGDLNWLMLRWPLEIVDREAWAAAIASARAHEARSIAIANAPAALRPEAGAFAGTLTEFQERGVAWLAHHRRTLLADEMGLGKTVQALGFLATLATDEAFPALIVAPPHLLSHWERMVARFLPNASTRMLRGLTPRPLEACDITLIHYGLLASWRHELEGSFSAIVFDEIHELRHSKSQKYSAASAICDGVTTVVGLSGTPIFNSGAEIWNVLNVIETHCLGDFHSFTREWCGGYGSEVVMEPAVLGAKLREDGLYLRRTKDEVLSELPEKRRALQEIGADQGLFLELIRPVLDQVRDFDPKRLTNIEQGHALQRIVNESRAATGLAKAPFVAQFVASLVDAGEPGVVFAHHHSVVDEIARRLGKRRVCRISGRESRAEKDAALKAMVDGRMDVAIVSLRTTAGIDGLQARCRWCAFAELDWSPSVHSQAEDRLHRMGQRDSVLAYYLVWNGEGSTDPDVMGRLGFKVSQFVGLMGDPDPTDDEEQLGRAKATEHMRRVVERLRSMLPQGASR